MAEWIRRDEGLKTIRVDIINEGDFLIPQVNNQHVIHYAYAWQAVAWELNDNLLAISLNQRSQLQFSLVGIVKQQIGSPMKALKIYQIIFWLFFSG